MLKKHSRLSAFSASLLIALTIVMIGWTSSAQAQITDCYQSGVQASSITCGTGDGNPGMSGDNAIMGVEAGNNSFSGNSTYVGYQAGAVINLNSGNFNNTAVGAMSQNNGGGSAVTLGYMANYNIGYNGQSGTDIGAQTAVGSQTGGVTIGFQAYTGGSGGSHVNIGVNAGSNSAGGIEIGTNSGLNSNVYYLLAEGYDAVANMGTPPGTGNNSNEYVVALGAYAGNASAPGGNNAWITLVGAYAGANAGTVGESNLVGYGAGSNSNIQYGNAFGYMAGANDLQVAGGNFIGANAGNGYQGQNGIMIGDNTGAGASAQNGGSDEFIGVNAGQNVGYNTSQGGSSTNLAIGTNAYSNGSGYWNVNIGDNVSQGAIGQIYEVSDTVFGTHEGAGMGGVQNVAIGNDSAPNWSSYNAVIFGESAINSTDHYGSNYTYSSMILGSNSFDNSTTQSAVLIFGENSGNNMNQTSNGNVNVIVGNNAGNYYSGSLGVIVGYNAGNNDVTNATPQSSNSVIMGANASSTGNETLVIGANAFSNSNNSVVIGANASSPNGIGNDVTIGANAVNTLSNSTVIGANSVSTDPTYVWESDVNGTIYSIFAGGPPSSGCCWNVFNLASLSIGAPGQERQLQNVAAGEIAPWSMDAINGSELYAAISQIIGECTSNCNGGGGGGGALTVVYQDNANTVATASALNEPSQNTDGLSGAFTTSNVHTGTAASGADMTSYTPPAF